MLPKRFQHKDPELAFSRFYYKCTTIYVNYKCNSIAILHNGHIGNTIGNVKEDFDGCFGVGSFQHAEKNCIKMSEEGNPEYFYFRYMVFN
jgi:hypothetical protein